MRTQGMEGYGRRLAAAVCGICLMVGAAVGSGAPAAAGPPAPAAMNLAEPVPLEMTHWTGSYAYLQGELQGAAFQAVRMPYGAGRRSMLIVLPDASVNFERFVSSITPRELNRWSGQLRSSFGNLSLPKLAVPDGLVRTPLDSLDPMSAPLSFDGSLAAARPFNMTVDRPFFYAVQDNKTHELLFVGVQVDPT